MKKLFLIFILLRFFAYSQTIPTPQDVFGFKIGEDKKLVDWNQIVSYFKIVDEKSERVQVQELGKTTLGKPFIMAIISSESNMKNLDKIKSIQKAIAKPYSLTPENASKLITQGKTIVLITMNIHSTEIASSQESVELLYELATQSNAQISAILENCVVLIVPSLNPDGLQLVVDWYKKTLGTPAEGSSSPELYHYYAGHDNNRDFFMYNLAETKLMAKVLYHEWFPEIVLDQHQMGSSGPRLFIPPYEDPVNPNISPSLNAETNMIGDYMITDMNKAGFKGVASRTTFNGYYPGTMSKTPAWHNRIGILTEAASVNIASPIYFPKGSITGMGQNLPENKIQVNNLNPFEEGWWRLRDIINYEKTAAYSVLDFAVLLKDKIKTTFYNLNCEQIEKDKHFGYLLPVDQHDPNCMIEMLKRLAISGIEIRKLTKPLTINDKIYPEGTFYISLSQPSRAYIKDLFEVQNYPNLKQYPGGPPKRPYDITGWTLPMQMGVEFQEVDPKLKVESEVINEIKINVNEIKSSKYYIIERRFINSFGIVFEIFKQKGIVYETTKEIIFENKILPAGSFLVPSDKIDSKNIEKLSNLWNVPIISYNGDDINIKKELKKSRIGIFQPYTSSADEGWTRFVLDQFKIDYTILHNEDFKNKEKSLSKYFDVLILADISPNIIEDGKESDRPDEESRIGVPQRPKQYQGGIGKEGTELIKEFVKSGGTLLCFGNSSNYAIEKLQVPAVNVLKKLSSNEFYAPGSIFEINLDIKDPLAFGMENKAKIYFDNSPAFRLRPYNQVIKNIGWYDESNPLRSGWIIGEENLFGKTALTEIPYENGRIILYGFRVQHRAQSYGTFKLFLNALFTTNRN